MAKRYSLALYTIKVYEKKNTKKEDPKPLVLSEKIDNNISFYEFINGLIKDLEDNVFTDKKSEKHLRVQNFNDDNTRDFYCDGIIEGGESGFSQKLYNINNKSERDKHSYEANLEPFFFCFHSTQDKACLALCLQRRGNVGLKTILVKAMRIHFQKKFPNHRLQIDDFLPVYYKKSFFENNIVKKIEFSYLTPVSDVTSLLEVDGDRDVQKKEAVIRLIIQPTRGFIHRIKGGIDSISNALSLLKPKNLNIGDDKNIGKSITLIDKKGNSRSFKISQDADILPYIDITDHIKVNKETGHPDFSDMKEVVNEVLVNSDLISR